VLAFGAWFRDRSGAELGRDFETLGADDDARHAIGEELPHRDVAAGIGEGDIDDRVELIAE